MHRIDAGSFDSRGWAVAQSTHGNFQVSMPGPFNDFSVLADPAGFADRIEGIGGKAPNGIVFSALKQIYRTTATAQAEFEKFRRGEGLPSAKVSNVTLPGFEAIDVSYTDEDSAADERVALAGTDIYTLTVEWPASAATTALALFGPFVESFRVLPKTPPVTENPEIWQHDQLNDAYMRTVTKDLCMKKTIATLGRSGCVTRECLASIGGATGECVSLASGDMAGFCATYDAHYLDKSCSPGDSARQPCAFLTVVKGGFCQTKPLK
jgi:hypothetical protein